MDAQITFDVRNQYENMFRRRMLALLSPTEAKAMVYIIDRTLGWMKDREYLSYREFEEGGKGDSAGAGITAKTAIKCVATLAAKGIIEIVESSKKKGTLILLNLAWGIQRVLREPKQSRKAPRTPKLSSSSVVNLTTQCGTPYNTGEVCSTTPLERNIKNLPERTTSANRAGRDVGESLQPVSKPAMSISEAINAGKAKHTAAAAEKRDRMVASARAGRVTGESLEQYWVDGIRDKNPRAVFKAWTGKERGQSKHILNLTSIRSGKILDFMFFCASEWELVIRAHFPWATSELSSEPNIGFVLKYLNQFANAYNNRDKLKARESMSMVERRVARLVDDGMDEEEARNEVEQAVGRSSVVRRERTVRTATVDHLKRFRQTQRPVGRSAPQTHEEAPPPQRVRDIEDVGLADFGDITLRPWEDVQGE